MFANQYIDFERTRWKLFQKPVLHTKKDISLFMSQHCLVHVIWSLHDPNFISSYPFCMIVLYCLRVLFKKWKMFLFQICKNSVNILFQVIATCFVLIFCLAVLFTVTYFLNNDSNLKENSSKLVILEFQIVFISSSMHSYYTWSLVTLVIMSFWNKNVDIKISANDVFLE